MIRRTLLVISLLGCVGHESAGGPDDAVSACATDLDPHLDKLDVPGLSAGLIAGGRLRCTAVAGDANIERQQRVEADTIFAWASVSKTVTAVATMILVDDGVIDLDHSIDDVLPFQTRNPNCSGEPITFRQLLTHTSSLRDADFYGDYYESGDSSIELGDFVRGYVTPGGDYYDAEQNFDTACPGASYDYSNVAIGLLGHAVETAAGLPFDDFCRQRIFEPLGMKETSFHLASLDPDRIAMPYQGRIAVGHLGFPTYPDGGLRTSVPELARVAAMMSSGGVLDGTRILSQASVDEMLRVQAPALDDTQGLIWFYDYDGVVGHDGSDPGTSGLMFFDPDSGTGALLVANGDWWRGDDDGAAADELFEQLLAEAAR